MLFLVASKPPFTWSGSIGSFRSATSRNICLSALWKTASGRAPPLKSEETSESGICVKFCGTSRRSLPPSSVCGAIATPATVVGRSVRGSDADFLRGGESSRTIVGS